MDSRHTNTTDDDRSNRNTISHLPKRLLDADSASEALREWREYRRSDR